MFRISLHVDMIVFFSFFMKLFYVKMGPDHKGMSET